MRRELQICHNFFGKMADRVCDRGVKTGMEFAVCGQTASSIGGLEHKDALKVIQGGAGSQLDKKLVKLFCSLQMPSRSSQTARRSGRKR